MMWFEVLGKTLVHLLVACDECDTFEDIRMLVRTFKDKVLHGHVCQDCVDIQMRLLRL